MDIIFTEDDYIRCDIVTGRLYRCLTSLIQEFLDVQFSEVFGSRWIDNIVKLADSISGPGWSTERNNLKALLEKKEEKGLVLMDKTCVDVTIANTLMLFTCYYIVSVPQCHVLSVDDMKDIIHTFENKPLTEYDGFDAEALRSKLIECIRQDVKVLLKCQEKMATQYTKSNGQVVTRKNGKIESDDFFKKIQRLVNNKNHLNSHMSTVSDPIASEREITDMIMNLEEFLGYLSATWEYPMKSEFLERYRKEITIIRYLRSTTQFAEVTNALSSVISAMPVDRIVKETDAADNTSNDEQHLSAFRRCFSLLSNANNHCAACTALMVESDTLENPCATIMLAFMYYCGWSSGHTAEEILMPVSVISDPNGWLALAEKFKTQSKEEEKTDKELSTLHRAQATAYYIGHAMVNKAPSAFMMAGYLGIMLENFEITKACFRYAGESDKKAKDLYNAFNNMQDETVFQKWASAQNKTRLSK
jgi:hypothetical protein